MSKLRPYISTILFGLIFISFFLPFAGGIIYGDSINILGISLVFGIGEYVNFYFPMFFILLVTIACLMISILFKGENKREELILSGVILFLLIITTIDVHLPLQIGFYFMLIFSLAIIVYNSCELFLMGKVPMDTMTMKCPACGAIVSVNETFCSQCGAKLK